MARPYSFLAAFIVPLISSTTSCAGTDAESQDSGAAGGASSTGGGTAAGGVADSLASIGGSTSHASGGLSATAGSRSTGGTHAGGSQNSSGGHTSVGGQLSTGGNISSGGATAAGGISSTGGDPAAGGSPSDGGVFPDSITTPKIMIVGDSIAAGPGCFKQHLLDNLTNDGISNFEFVGEYGDDCGNVRHSAVSCSTADNFTSPQFMMSNCSQGQSFPGLSPLMATHNPDMVLLQLGVNDIWGGNTAFETVLGRYETLIGQMRAHNPQVVVVVAQIHKINTIDCANGSFDASAQSLIEAVPMWAAALSTQESPLFVADLWTNSFVAETDDCVHPDATGAERMGQNWFNAIADLLR